MQPSVGRIVHYVSHGSPVLENGTQRYTSECRAAIVTEVGMGTGVRLAVLNPEGMFFTGPIPEYPAAGERKGGTWHWPERV